MKSILIVEDIQVVRRVLAMNLQKMGYNVFEAENGQQGLKIALREKPDLLMTGLLMPVMDGFEMVKEIRKDITWGKNANILILSDLKPDAEVNSKLEGVKPIEYMIKKDWTLEELSVKVKSILG